MTTIAILKNNSINFFDQLDVAAQARPLSNNNPIASKQVL
jgi:hypothetical protein